MMLVRLKPAAPRSRVKHSTLSQCSVQTGLYFDYKTRHDYILIVTGLYFNYSGRQYYTSITVDYMTILYFDNNGRQHNTFITMEDRTIL